MRNSLLLLVLLALIGVGLTEGLLTALKYAAYFALGYYLTDMVDLFLEGIKRISPKGLSPRKRDARLSPNTPNNPNDTPNLQD